MVSLSWLSEVNSMMLQMISLVWRATYANGDGTNVLIGSKFKSLNC